MSSRVAPWLDGLTEAWELPPPQKPNAFNTIPTIPTMPHDAQSVRDSSSRIPRPSLGTRTSSTRPDNASQSSIQKTRSPLAPLNKNDTNTLRGQHRTSNLVGSRSMSEASDASALACGTMVQRSKSASPDKKQETLEWKKRLMKGAVGYGDQTDLFGPSGLENIFSPGQGSEKNESKAQSNKGWFQQSDTPAMPSSPPPWPSSLMKQAKNPDEGVLDSVVEEDPADGSMRQEGNTDDEESFTSNPFALESSGTHQGHNAAPCALPQSSPEKAFVEPTVDELPNRTISGQTELEQEDFSPVFVSKHTTVTGQVGYAALDSHLVKQFQSQKVDLRHPSQNEAERASEEERIDSDQSAFTDGPPSDSIAADANFSFSENLPTGSPFPDLGQNVQFKRGGYSQQGSFKQRLLSPGPSRLHDSLDLNTSAFLSPLPPHEELPSAPTPPQAPTTPIEAEEAHPRSSGSPLKLFGAHDTFTNARLMRRLSQLNPDGTLKIVPEAAGQIGHERTRTVSKGSSFGNGELDDHTFDAEITITGASDSEQSFSDRSPGSEVAAPGSKVPLGFRFEVSSPVTDTFKMRRMLSKSSVATSKDFPLHNQTKQEAEQRTDNNPSVRDFWSSRKSINQETRIYSVSKRPPTSPFKDPTPKRRRTLHASELENGIQTMNDSYHNSLQEALSSRKRKDARQGETQNTADPVVLAHRKILRPRNPTPSQKQRRQQIHAELKQAAEEFAEQEPEKLEAVMEQIDSSMASEDSPTLEQQAQTLASEVAAFTFKVHRPSGEVIERKRSVTTQDFLDEAMMVMNLIRAKARPQSNLGSVEESDGEALGQSLRAQDLPQDDSLLSVSRAPSREGSGGGWRPRAPVLQSNARVISHLRKFEETEEVDDTNFIANSIASLQVDDEEHVNQQVIVVDEEANVRITGPAAPPARPKRTREEQDTDSRPVSQRSQQSTLQTRPSTGISTTRTIATTSSSTRKSDNVGTLAPDAVAHLIGNQVGGMTFDKDQQRWVRIAKSPERKTKSQPGSFLELPSNVTSDDDPFREISDLAVDEAGEMRRLSQSGKRGVSAAAAAVSTEDAEDTTQEDGCAAPVQGMKSLSQETVVTTTSRPVTRDSNHVKHVHSSSVASKHTALASSQQEAKIETRATSWSDEEMAKMSAYGRLRQGLSPLDEAQQTPDDDVAIASVRRPASSSPTSPTKSRPTARVATFNSFRELHRTDEDGHNGLPSQEREAAAGCERSQSDEIVSPRQRQAPLRPSTSPSRTTRQMSLRKRTLTTRFHPEPLEQSELSIIAPLPGDRMMSLSLSVSRLVSKRQQPIEIVAEAPSSPSAKAGVNNSTFLLSDLPDFTVHEEDAERPSERALASRLAQHAAVEVNDRYAVAIKELVKILTDVNEDEPYWEDLKHLDLHARSLGSLYGLNDFCTAVQGMNVSNNTLQHLQGVPTTLRRLDARSNLLSGLTCWNHLANLQYLDVSDNRLETLDGLGCLIHLRELRADGNHITRLDGTFDLDGLLKLRLRGNRLHALQLKDSRMVRLTHLDVSDNKISAVEGLEKLFSLVDLRMDNNTLLGNTINPEDPTLVLPHLHSLSLRNCSISHLDAAHFPSLTNLNVDDNKLSTIQAISSLARLDTLSMRRQSLSANTPFTILASSLEARSIHLSGTSIPILHLPTTPLLNLQHLDLASTGLNALPPNFGLLMPNLRTLNLNFNNLKDLRPLLNCSRLRRLEVAFNRIARLRKSVAVLERLQGLRELDLRGNPLTVGFYSPSGMASRCSAPAAAKAPTSLVRRRADCASTSLTWEEEDEAEQRASEAEERARYSLSSVAGGMAEAAEDDARHRARLDDETALRRRVYEVLLANGCAGLEDLDGSPFRGSKAVGKRDAVWERLLELGVLRKSGRGEGVAVAVSARAGEGEES